MGDWVFVHWWARRSCISSRNTSIPAGSQRRGGGCSTRSLSLHAQVPVGSERPVCPAVSALRMDRRANLVLSLSVFSLIFANALLHIRGAILQKRYYPGVISSALIYIPLAIYRTPGTSRPASLTWPQAGLSVLLGARLYGPAHAPTSCAARCMPAGYERANSFVVDEGLST